jgi:hypothetical protein
MRARIRTRQYPVNTYLAWAGYSGEEIAALKAGKAVG